MGLERGRLAVALDPITDSLIMVGQHGVYCTSPQPQCARARSPGWLLGSMQRAKALIQSVMEELRKGREQGAGGRGLSSLKRAQ